MSTLDLVAAARHALAVVGRRKPTTAADAEHPDWCAGGHHCTARHTNGEHRSIPEIWETSAGRAVAVRTRRASDGIDHLEIRLIVELAYDDRTAEQQCRTLITASCATVHDVLFGGMPGSVEKGQAQ